MGDLYAEVLVRRTGSGADRAVKNGLVALFVLFVLLALFFDYRFIVAVIIFAAACIFLIPRLDVEFEYLLVNQELDVDIIYGRSRRKNVEQFHLEKMELFVPYQSARLAPYNSSPGIRVKDYSSGNRGPDVYAMIIRKEEGLLKVLLEPDRQMREGMLKTFPHKVFVD